VQAAIDHAYGQFIGLVAGQRKLTREQVDAVAQGRVWGGNDARGHALVDRLGSWADALAAAHKRAKLPEGTVARLRYFEVEPGRLQKLLMGFGVREVEAAQASQRLEWLGQWLVGAAPAESAVPWAAAGLGLASPELAAALVGDLAWLADVAARRQPFAAATHCLCGAP